MVRFSSHIFTDLSGFTGVCADEKVALKRRYENAKNKIIFICFNILDSVANYGLSINPSCQIQTGKIKEAYFYNMPPLILVNQNNIYLFVKFGLAAVSVAGSGK